jgi:hypothetical protein
MSSLGVHGDAGRDLPVVYSSHRGSRRIEHIGSAHDEAGLELLK